MYFWFLYLLSTVLIILSSVFLILYGFHEVNEPYTIPVRRSLCSLYIYYITYNALKQLMKNIKIFLGGPTQIQMIPKTNLEIQLLCSTYIQSFIEMSFCLFSDHVTNGQIERHTNKQTNYLENRPVKSCKYLRLVNDTFEEILHYLEKNTHLESVIFRRKILIT